MNLKHHLQHEIKNDGPGTYFYLVPSGYGPGFCAIKYLSILYNIAEYQQYRLKTTGCESLHIFLTSIQYSDFPVRLLLKT